MKYSKYIASENFYIGVYSVNTCYEFFDDGKVTEIHSIRYPNINTVFNRNFQLVFNSGWEYTRKS